MIYTVHIYAHYIHCLYFVVHSPHVMVLLMQSVMHTHMDIYTVHIYALYIHCLYFVVHSPHVIVIIVLLMLSVIMHTYGHLYCTYVLQMQSTYMVCILWYTLLVS